MDCSIIIVNYRQRGLVRQCLQGIARLKVALEHEVIVVDNASGDGCLAMVERLFPWAVTVASSRNVGFGHGNNLGLRRARGEFLLICNPDIVFFPGQVESLVTFLRTHSKAGVVGPRLVYPDGSVQASCRRFPTLLTPLYRRTKLGRLPSAMRQLRRYLMGDFNHAVNRQVDWLFGACLLIRRQALDQVGWFDRRFFMYFEDLDFCRRCWLFGWEVWYVATVTLVHYHQRLSAEHGGLRGAFDPLTRQHVHSALRYYRKYFGQPLPPASPSGQAEVATRPAAPGQAMAGGVE